MLIGRDGRILETLHATPSLEARPNLNYYQLRQYGILEPGRESRLSWRGAISVSILAASNALAVIVDSDDDRHDPQRLVIVSRRRRIAGSSTGAAWQHFFECPDCANPVQDLYLDNAHRFVCRKCGRWRHGSRKKRDQRDPVDIVRRLRMRIGASPCMADPLPPRPSDPVAAREYDGVAVDIAAYEDIVMKQTERFIRAATRFARRRGFA